MFVSPYPWGWLPYRYGNWMFVPGFGWMWQPGYWNTWSVVPRFTHTTAVQYHPPVAPTGTTNTVIVGKGGPKVATATPSKMVLTKGTAGLGIARGSLGNLSHLNSQVAKSGSVEVRSSPQFAASSSRGGGFSGSHSSGMRSQGGGHTSSGHTSGGGGSHR